MAASPPTGWSSSCAQPARTPLRPTRPCRYSPYHRSAGDGRPEPLSATLPCHQIALCLASASSCLSMQIPASESMTWQHAHWTLLLQQARLAGALAALKRSRSADDGQDALIQMLQSMLSTAARQQQQTQPQHDEQVAPSQQQVLGIMHSFCKHSCCDAADGSRIAGLACRLTCRACMSAISCTLTSMSAAGCKALI